MVEVLNRQTIKRINLKELVILTSEALRFLDVGSYKVSLVLCDNRLIASLNKKFFKRNRPTDVISFPLKDNLDIKYLGEVVVSVEQAALRAKGYGNSWRKELLLYIVHGILHLLGYRDNTEKQRERMERKQNAIMDKLFLRK